VMLQVSTSTGILARQVQLNVVRTEAFIQGKKTSRNVCTKLVFGKRKISPHGPIIFFVGIVV
jgi:hypothetical protein